MVSKEKGIVGASGTVTGKLADLFLNGAKSGYGGVDIEVIDPIGETQRQLPLDYIKMLEENETVEPLGITKKEFIKTLPAWARPAFKNDMYVGFVGPLHQEQLIRLQSGHLRASKPKEPDYSVAEIDAIVGDTGYEPPSTPEDFGPNFGPWVQAHKKELAKIKGWEGILDGYGCMALGQLERRDRTEMDIGKLRIYGPRSA